MFIRFSALLPVAAIAAVAAAAPSALKARDGVFQCNTGSIQCCDITYPQSDAMVSTALEALGIVLPDTTGLVGFNCTPITVIGTGSGATCSQEPVCCTGNTSSGLINFGCSPLNL